MKIRPFQLSAYEANCYLISNKGKAVLIDPGDYSMEIANIIRNEDLQVTHILITHIHLDHFYAATAFSKLTGAKIYINPADGYLIKEEVDTWKECMYSQSCGMVDYEPFDPGMYEFLGEKCEVIATPGHTPGSLTLHFPDHTLAFVGDVIFSGSVGRSDFNGGDYETLMTTIKSKIFKFPPDTKLYTGHGPVTTVDYERRNNSFVK
ncbi:Glyoxylase, beta-lactamase superfamily II [Desulfuromusa kysingii]|uniref:Glyoxylase, beta-lactamase superfamily II n=1 Tax=Desulfuromusa kysingii TaxID=37625 RepID=A0A1H4C7S5_9BACT|nr:MBL fold metallo-hydrolase [Desulfuromusa kysingii]SEA56380.1 Glyoxylase, beta-lactamase superfamily II [Desulfuromusa kysingii]